MLKKISLTLQSGEALHITGPNGVGKSSLLRAMVGLLPFEGGMITRTPSVFFLPTEKEGADDQTVKAHLALWQDFEAAVMNDGMTPLLSRNQNDLFLPPKVLGRPMPHLSSGMQQRVGLSRLTQTRARLWVLDEPWQSLDQKAAIVLDDCLTRHIARGGAVVWTHHGERSFSFQPRLMDLSAFVSQPDTEDLWPF